VWPIPDKGIRKRLHRIAAPTLLLWGDRDRVNPIVYGEEWQRRIKGSEVRLLPGGHMLLDEAPAAAAEAVAAFLGGGRGAAGRSGGVSGCCAGGAGPRV